jgi:transcriptional regulator with PAS, ATPase and Fis domain
VKAGTGPAVLVPPGPPARRDPRVVAEDPAMLRVLELVERVAPGGITVLLLGETGTGKEVVASVLHAASGRPGPFLRLNCAAISPTLLESELFGHEKGAFTGATGAKPGLLESAEGGTVLLDEIGEMPVELQSRLLRVIEEREVLRVGGREPRRIDVRFVAATNRDLLAACDAGAFRRDLYYRLNGMSVSIPPLRERPADVEPLARRFLEPSGATLSPEALAVVTAYRWPGNARELRNALERAALLCGPSRVIAPEHLPAEVRAPGAAGSDTPLTGSERERIEEALRRCAGNQTHAARMLGISRRTLVNRLRELDIPRPRSPRR